MTMYVIKRLLQLIPILLGITFLSFAMMHIAGSDAVVQKYDRAGIAVAAIVCLGIYASAIVDPKKLMKSAAILIAAIAVIVVAYLVAPGADPVGYNGLPQSKSVLKLTDTILILTYVFCGATILSVIVGAIVSGARNKK